MNSKSKEVYKCMMCKKIFFNYPEHGICDNCGHQIEMKKNRLRVCGEKKMILIKISDETAITSMNAGTFWFQSPKFYQNYKGNDAIGDVNECAFETILDVSLDQLRKYVNLSKGEVFEKDGNKYRFEKILNGTVYVSSVYQNCYRLLCFYMLQIDENNRIIKPDEKMKLFGTHFSIIKNRLMLEEEIGNYIKNANYDLAEIGTVIEYITDKYRGIYTPSCKFEKYAYQNEYRIILGSLKYGKMPEEEKKIVNLTGNEMDKIMTEPIPIERLWISSTLEDIL